MPGVEPTTSVSGAFKCPEGATNMKTSVDPHVIHIGAIATIILGALCLPGTAGAQTIFACRNDTNGDLRYVTGPGQCRQHETEVSWTSGAGVGGHGTPGKVPLWTGSGTTLTDSHIKDSAAGVTISVPVSVSASGTGPTVSGSGTNGVGVTGISSN